MRILAIESSCDETAAAIYDTKKRKLCANVVVSQIDIFKSYGGVIPEVAARSHLEAILPVIDKAFADAGLTVAGENDWAQIDAIAVTHTPGLLGSLLIGTLTARTLALVHQKPLYLVHHLKSHIYSCWIESGEQPEQFPVLALVVSGGHTQIIKMWSAQKFAVIGTTMDDAVGECFDKIAKILGLPYPGGPAISQAAARGERERYQFPHPKVEGLNFSFSGLKTAVLRLVQKECGVGLDYPSKDLQKLLQPQQVADLAASFENCACEILLEKLQKALVENPEVKTVMIAGGVSANGLLREKALAKLRGVTVLFPPRGFSGDNAAMVALAAAGEIAAGVQPADPRKVEILPRSEIR